MAGVEWLVDSMAGRLCCRSSLLDHAGRLYGVWAVLFVECACLPEKGAVTVKFCEYCGKSFDDDKNTCPDCGAKLRPLQNGETEENALTITEMMALGLL